eukprot:167787_1
MDDIDDLEKELNAPNDDEWDETRFQQRMDTVANASANLGALLLKGWCMLADECQKCHTPLMSLRDSAPRCVLCNPVEQAPQPPPHKKKKLNTVNEKQELNVLNDKLWNDDAFAKRVKKSEDASAKIGELLLKGWTMLAQHCDKCQTPLMRLRGGQPMCCICSASNPAVNVPKQETKAHVQPAKKVVSSKPKQPQTQPQTQPLANAMNGINDVERKTDDDHYSAPRYPPYGYYDHPHAPRFGFGPRQDQQLRRTMGDIVKTVLDKMSVINERMSRNNNSLQNDIVELNQLMEFLQNVN